MNLSRNQPVTPTPMPASPAHYPGGTERRRTQQTVSVIMPGSGRVAESVHEDLVHEMEEGFVTTRTVRIPVADCSCPVDDVKQLRECSSCQAVICRLHSGTCQGGCGRVFCTSCARRSEDKFLCRNCARRERTKRRWGAILGFFWSSG